MMEELGGSGLAGVRHLHDEREKRRRPRTTTSSRARSFAGGPGGFSHPRNNTATVKGGPLPRAPRLSPRQRRRVEDTHAYLCARVDPVMGELILALMEIKPDNIREAALDHLLSKKRVAHVGGGEDNGEIRTSSTTADTRADPASQNRVDVGVNGGVGAASTAAGGQAVAPHQRLARRQDRLFMAREIGPLVTELIRRTLRCMPTDVESFLVEQLQGGGIAPRGRGTATADSLEGDEGSKPRPPATEDIDLAAADSSCKHRLQNDNHKNSNTNANPHRHRPKRPSTARSRLQQAQSLDQHVQQTSPPLSGRTTEVRRSPSPPRGPKNGGLTEDEDNGCAYGEERGGEEAPLSSSRGNGGGSRAVAQGVKESHNKPWDAEVSAYEL